MHVSDEGFSNPNTIIQIPANWRLIKIKDLCHQVTSGGTPLRSEKSYYLNGQINWFKTQELQNWFLTDSKEKITKTGLENSSAKLFPKDTILMAMYGDGKTITSLGILSKPSATNQACCVMIPNQEICLPLFLFYSLVVYKDDFLFIARGGAQRNLNINLIQNFGLLVPPLDIQEKIVNILGSLDDKIEINRQMNQTLETIASAIFKSWFVDFDPVYAKMEGRDYPLPPEIMDLFPDELEESELGLIPKGWKETPFGNLIDFHSGGDWGKEEENGDHRIATRIIRGTDIPELHNLGLGKVPIRYIKQESFQKRKIESGDIIIEISGGSNDQPTGRSLLFTNSLLDRFTLPIAPTSFCRLLRPINLRVAVLLSVHLRIIYDKGIMWNYQNRSTGISNFQTNYFLENEKVVLPSDDVLEKFFLIVYPILIKMQSNESISLQKLRNTLLPKFISGEIQV